MGQTHTERGFTLIEVLAALAILAVLVAIAVPTYIGQVNQARDTHAKAELRDVLPAVKAVIAEPDASLTLEQQVKTYSPTAPLDNNAIDGIALSTSFDAAVCMWRISESGKAFAVREPGASSTEPTLFGEWPSLPAACPEAGDAAAAGFTPDPW